MAFVRLFCADEDGAAAIEYGLILGLIALVIVAAVTTAGTEMDRIWNAIVGWLQLVPS